VRWGLARREEVARNWSAWLASQKGTPIVSEYRPEAQICVLRLSLPTELPDEFSLGVGDSIHNLRSALDHLVHQLVLLNSETPTRYNQFPIIGYEEGRRNGESLASLERRWKKAAESQLEGVRGEHVELVHSVQPFLRAAVEMPGKPIDAWLRQDPLVTLREMSNTDKHRFLHLTSLALVEPGGPLDLTYGLQGIAAVGDREDLFYVGSRDGAVVGWVEVTPAGPDPRLVHTGGEVMTTLVFAESPFSGIHVFLNLGNLVR
jgi:hypothetical protein